MLLPKRRTVMTRVLSHSIIIVLTLALLVSHAFAQSPPQALPPNHPDLFHAFFTEATALGASSLNSPDQAKVSPLVQAINRDLGALDADLQKYSALVSSRGRTPDTKVLEGFAASRRLLDLKGVRTLRLGLPNRVSRDLEAYINGPFRQKVNAAAGAH